MWRELPKGGGAMWLITSPDCRRLKVDSPRGRKQRPCCRPRLEEQRQIDTLLTLQQRRARASHEIYEIMAEPLPAALKIPEVQRFVHRANQLRSIKPAIAYWCTHTLPSLPSPLP